MYPPNNIPLYPIKSKCTKLEISTEIKEELIGMNEIAKVKNEVKLAQWTEMVKSRNESGLTVTDWCKQNGINLKTYYYRLKLLRQAVCNEIEQHDIVHIESPTGTEIAAEKIELSVGDVKISLPDSFNEDTLKRLLGVLR